MTAGPGRLPADGPADAWQGDSVADRHAALAGLLRDVEQ